MRVLLIEDEKNIASFIVRGLSNNGWNVTSAPDGETGLELLSEFQYDVLVLDLILPGIDGWEVCERIRRNHEDPIPILMLSALNETDDVVKGLDGGADDYLGKPFKMQELIARLHALCRRNRGFLPPKMILQVADLKINLETKEVRRGDQRIRLTAREFNLLHFLMTRTGQVVTRLELLEHVWGVDFDTGTNVVDVYVNYLRNKIDRDFSNKLVHTVYGIGYTLRAEDDPAR